EENGFIVALQYDVEAEPGLGCVFDRARDQRRPAIRRYGFQDRIVRVERLVRKVDSGHQMLQQAARENGDVDMRRLEADVARGDRTGPDRSQAIASARIGCDAAETVEVRIELLLLR